MKVVEAQRSHFTSILSVDQLVALLHYVNKLCDMYGVEPRLSMLPCVPHLLLVVDERLSDVVCTLAVKLMVSERYLKDMLQIFFKFNLKTAAKCIAACPSPVVSEVVFFLSFLSDG